MTDPINQLLILAGPSGTGKSTLIKAIKQDKLPSHISQKLNIKNLSILPNFQDDDFQQLISQLKSQKQVKSIIVYYDLYNNYSDKNYHKKLLKIIQHFEEVVVVTVFVPNHILIKRIRLRIIKTFIKECLKPLNSKFKSPYIRYQWNKYQGYTKTNVASKIYEEWFEFTASEWVSSHWLLDSSQKELNIINLERRKQMKKS
jgi:GTPase SAR1 family protein